MSLGHGLGDTLPGYHEVVRVLPHGKQVRSNRGLQSLPDFLLHSSSRLSSVKNIIIRGNNINYLEDRLKKDFILQFSDILFNIRIIPLRQVVLSKSIGI